MADETPLEDETPITEEIELVDEGETSVADKIAGGLLFGAAVIGAVTVGKKAYTWSRDFIATHKAGKSEKTSTPESETPESPTEEK